MGSGGSNEGVRATAHRRRGHGDALDGGGTTRVATGAADRRVRAVLDAMADQTVVIDPAGRIVMVNDAWRAAGGVAGPIATGRAPGGAGEPAPDQVGIGHLAVEYLVAAEAAADAGAGVGAPAAATVAVQLRELLAGRLPRFVAEYPCERADGTTRWYTLTAEAIAPPTGGAVLVHRDVTQQRHAEDELRRLALHDLLTGLPNRLLILDRIEQAIQRDPGRVGVMLLDLDRFKLVNDSLGHAVGDAVLVQVADRLRAAIRSTDTVGRLGGDEFVVVCDGIAEGTGVTALAEQVLAAFQPPLHVLGRELYVRASLGITTSAGHEVGRPLDPQTLLRDADTAMYAAKAAGGQRWRAFDQALRRRSVERLDLEHDLHRALEQHQLHLFYQPKRHLATGRLVGWEALARWDHPERGPIPPVEFVTVAEESELVVDLGRWAIDQACHQLAVWDDVGGLRGATMAVNISARHLASERLLPHVTDALVRHRIRPERLELEVTETALIHHIDLIDANARQLAALGVRMSLDDFGTGSATLTHVGRLPLHALKIDRSFVSELAMEGAPRGATAIVRSIIAIAHAFGLDVIAEGIETAAQLTALRHLGCRIGQGFLLGPPLHPSDVGPRTATATS